MTSAKTTLTLAAVGDLHCPRTPPAVVHALLGEAAEQADVLLLCGDLTDRGTSDETKLLAREIASAVKIPVIAVLGNHDHESGTPEVVIAGLMEIGVHVLEGDAVEIHGVGFAGVKGFGGGFGEHALQPWGEEIMKRFVRESVEEALRLESALARLRTPQRIAVLHYAPVAETIVGEPPEIYPFLGSSRLEEPLARYPVAACFHGHAHHGAPEGRMRSGSPVYNVAHSLLARSFPDRPAFKLIELPIEPVQQTR
jgi:Icc-related predicted phosphoesterase